jgi:hypothetical protein
LEQNASVGDAGMGYWAVQVELSLRIILETKLLKNWRSVHKKSLVEYGGFDRGHKGFPVRLSSRMADEVVWEIGPFTADSSFRFLFGEL